MILSKKGITKALISLGGCPGWSAPLLFANPQGQIFSRRGPIKVTGLETGCDETLFERIACTLYAEIINAFKL